YVFIGAYRGLCYKTSTLLSSFDFRIPFILLRCAFRDGTCLMHRIPLAQLRVAVFHWKPSASLIAQLAFGILIGTLIGFPARYEYEWDVHTYEDGPNFVVPSQDRNVTIEDIYIRCVIIVYKKREKKTHYINAIKDTYASRCNQTLYFMDSKKLQDEFAEELRTVCVNTWQTMYHWNFYRHILRYVSTHLLNTSDLTSGKRAIGWTVVGDEQMYLMVENLRRYLLKVDSREALLLGRVTQTRSLLSLLFPFGTYTIVSTRASTIYSDSALRAMADDKCSGWSVPVATEKALVTCASTMNVRIIDPVDHEGMYLLHSKNPKSLIPMSAGFSLGSPYKKADVKVECCSDETITFGDMNYKQHRMVDFLTRSKVFGIS
uniref:Uncharacterized protein n=1 Tax=Parascaris univalens TaxID=6257 RepID=A0A915B8D1_PARUN